MSENNWDTEETSRILMNDEGLYDMCCRIARCGCDTDEIAEEIEYNMAGILPDIDYCEVDIDRVDWTAIAEEFVEEIEL